MYDLTLKTPPIIEPVTLSEIKQYLRLNTDVDSDDIIRYKSLEPAVRGIAIYTGTSVDILTYLATVVLYAGESVGNAILTVKVQESSNDSTYTDVYEFSTITSANDNTIFAYDYVGTKQYIRVIATITSTTPTDTVSFSVNIDKITEETSEDIYLNALIKAARIYCENFQHRAYITQTWELSLPYFITNEIEIPMGNLITVDSVKYKNSDGITTTLTVDTDYIYSKRGILGRLVPAYGKTWDNFEPYPLDAVIIEFTCGYGATAASVPETVKQAIKLLISHWYENRLPIEANMKLTKELDFTVTNLLCQERIVLM